MPTPSTLFIADSFDLESPAIQLLDRSLAGWAENGRYHAPPARPVVVHSVGNSTPPTLDSRRARFPFEIQSDLPSALANAALILWFPSPHPDDRLESRATEILNHAPATSIVFAYGDFPSPSIALSARLASAKSRNVQIVSASVSQFAPRLPERRIPPAGPLHAGLLLSPSLQDPDWTDLAGAWWSLCASRPGGEAGIRRIRAWQDRQVWDAARERLWPLDLLTAALSRSDNPLDKSDTESRPQDLAGLGLIPKVTRAPKLWQIEHQDGFLSHFAQMDGLLKDACVAFKARNTDPVSAQLLRPDKAHRFAFDHLAAALEACVQRKPHPFQTLAGSWTHAVRPLLPAALARAGQWLATPNLHF